MGPASSWIVAIVFVVAFLATWGISKWDVSRLGTSGETQLIAWRGNAFSQIETSVRQTFTALHEEAERMATSPAIRSGFRSQLDRQPSYDQLVRATNSWSLPDRYFVEIYDYSPALLAWKGPVFPMDAGVTHPDFLAQSIETVAKDGAKRTAFVVWHPISDGNKAIGVVRMGVIVESYMPLKNDYLRDYSWSEEWTKRLKTSTSFRFGEDTGLVTENERAVRGTLGGVVGKVSIQLPSLESVKIERARRYQDVQAFWVFMLLLWITLSLTRHLWTQSELRMGSEGLEKNSVTLPKLGGYLVYLVAVRWTLLWLDIPSRWQQGKSPLAPLFDPQHLGSVFGFGALRTIGDLGISALFLMLATLVVLRVTSGIRQAVTVSLHFNQNQSAKLQVVALVTGHVLVSVCISWFLFQLSSHAIQDSTLDYFARSGLLPERLILVVFGSLLVTVFSLVLLGGRALWILAHWSRTDLSLLPSQLKLALIYAISALFFGFLGNYLGWNTPIEVIGIVLISMIAAARTNPIQPARRSPIVALRHIVPIVMTTSLLLFPMLEISSDQKTELRMKDAALSFSEDKDSRVMFAISQVLDLAAQSDFEAELDSLQLLDPSIKRIRTDSLAEESSRGLLLSALAGYNVTVTLHQKDGTVLGRYSNLIRRVPRSTRDAADMADFGLFRAMYREFGESGPMIEKLTGISDQNRFRYAGFLGHETARVQTSADAGAKTQATTDPASFYLLVRAEQRALTESAGTPFPKVLSPAGYYGNRYADLSVAEFKDGVLIRTQGRSFGKSFLDESVTEQLRSSPEAWLNEKVRDRSYQTYYRNDNSLESGLSSSVIAVRRRTTNFFDQLYHLLRIVVAGMFLATPFYVGGIFWRFRKSKSLAEPRHFRDRVLNAFFSVGVVTVIAMGFVGLGVVSGENERAIESWLRQHLDRVEETLQLEARGEELPYRVLDRISIDSLSARVGLDLNIYHGIEIEQASRPELIRDRLIETRLPIEAYEALYFDGFRFITVNEKLGSFGYTAGYRALTDERGLPHYVVSIPTLPEQERIEEERARTVAYLFGALLLLVLVVMVTASLLANALTRPIAQLRAGLQAVAAGHFERIAQIDSKDEIADLVDSFNTMQDQLEESQRLIGQHERQLAWKEMARQVAHEIKNPLTPMKLSIQHLRSAFLRKSADGTDDVKFAAKFDQTTTTLTEQIDTLARIANEFSSFGRMPTHIREEVDLNAVIKEAVELMQAEDNVQITTDLGPGRYIVNADREALRRVYVNFLKNAIQSVPEDRMAEIVVTSRLEQEGDKTIVLSRVTDNGAGIPRNLWEKIFVPSFSTKTSGTGLGLAIARKTVENMDGDIGFDTQFEKGTTFWIKVPLVKSDV
jgi:two-component system, NtrC family, nitrogen regulation sensor histidine kinase NtrY